MKTIKFMLTICLAMGISVLANAQNITVTGKVTDENNQVLSGVNVNVKGAKISTATDNLGMYKIATQKGATLVFSLIGYNKKEVVIKNSVVNVTLISNTVLTEPSAINCEEFEGLQVSSIDQALQGRVGGLNITRHSKKEYDSYRNPIQPNYCPPINPYPINNDTEEYGSFKENRFIAVSTEALSTFSLDVDAASYGNIRRMINQGQMPEKDAVRIEELINYFSYDYAQPTGKHPVNIVTETTTCPWNTKHKLVRIGIKAKEIPSHNLPSSNFVFLIDVSGSMNDANKLELVKSSLKLLTNNLREKDHVSIVVYAGAAGEVLPSTSGNDRQKIKEALDNLQAGGSTAGGAGIQLAYKIAEKNFIKGGNNRIILCTDGDFNVGISSTTDLEKLIEEKRKSGVYLTVLGYGMGNYKDNKLQTLSEKGNGNHAYIDNIQEANKVLVNEFGSTMYTVAKDVKLQIEFNPAHVNAYRLVGYESRLLNKEDFNDDTKDAGELGSGHTVTALYEIIPMGVENTYGGVGNLKYQPTKKISPALTDDLSGELLNVKLRYKKPNEQNSIKMEIPVLMKDLNKEPTKDFKFIMAVAMFGQLLKSSDFKGDVDYKKVIEYAKAGVNNDENGYRREFIRLAEAVNQMVK